MWTALIFSEIMVGKTLETEAGQIYHLSCSELHEEASSAAIMVLQDKRLLFVTSEDGNTRACLNRTVMLHAGGFW